MANVYSVLLFEGSNTSTSRVDSSPVPTGFVWVVREIVCSMLEGSDDDDALYGIEFTIGGTWPLAMVTARRAVQSAVYRFERHTVVNAGEFLSAQSYDVGWYWRMSGYQLTLP